MKSHAAYEKGHQRAALSVYTFQPLEHDKFDRSATGNRPGALTIDRAN